LNTVFDNHLLDKRCLSLFLVLLFIQPLQGVLAAEYKESEKPIEEIIEERKDPDESELMEEPEEAVTKDTVEEEAEPEEEEEEAIEEPAVPEEELPPEEEVIPDEEKGMPKLTPVPEPEVKPEAKPEIKEKPPEKEKKPKKKKPKKKVERPKGFFKGARIELKSRTVYIDRDFASGVVHESFATGGSLMFRSGKWKDFFTVHSEVFTSQKLYGDIDRDGAQLLRDRQKELTVLGTAYAQFDYKKVRLRVGRQDFSLPYVNRNYSRMIPNTFEAVAVTAKRGKFEGIGGYIDKIKKRNSGSFVSMSNAAGVSGDSDEGLAMAGVLFNASDNLDLGILNFYTFNVVNIFYSEINYTKPLKDKKALKFSAQFTDQRSVGDELLSTSPFQTQVVSVEGRYGFKDTVFRAAYSATSESGTISSPYGGYPGYISLMKSDFNLAGEQAWMVGLTYNLSGIGLKGLSMNTKYASGFNAETRADGSLRVDEQEFDITLDYYPPAGRPLAGFWLRLRAAKRWQDGKDDTHDFRALLNYTYSVK
jgi:hypothetical protein